MKVLPNCQVLARLWATLLPHHATLYSFKQIAKIVENPSLFLVSLESLQPSNLYLNETQVTNPKFNANKLDPTQILLFFSVRLWFDQRGRS